MLDGDSEKQGMVEPLETCASDSINNFSSSLFEKPKKYSQESSRRHTTNSMASENMDYSVRGEIEKLHNNLQNYKDPN